MMNAMDFFVGILVGASLGVGITLAVGRFRRWLGYSEAGRLTGENRELKRRLTEKDRHISRMLAETERLADKLGKTASHLKEDARLIQADVTLALTQEESK
jgi:hypothetical protein